MISTAHDFDHPISDIEPDAPPDDIFATSRDRDDQDVGSDKGLACTAMRHEPNQISREAVEGGADETLSADNSGNNGSAFQWSEIRSLDERELPDFPAHVLPKVLRQWVEEESVATQTPADLGGLLTLAVCSSLISRWVVVMPREGWHEPVNLFVTILLESGNRKSAVFSDATKPLRELETERIKAARPNIAREQSERRQAEALLKKLEGEAVKSGDTHARYEAGQLAAELSEQSEPVLPRLIVDDATAEILGVMLDKQGGRIASMSPEGGVFDLMAGLYSKNNMPQFGVYLMGHSGDDLTTDRITRDGVYVKRPALTCAYAIQPQVIQGLAGNPAFRGRGLLARFLYAAPRSWIGRRAIAPPPVAEQTKENYRRMIHSVASEFEDAMSDAEPVVLRLSSEASDAFYNWETEIESMLADGGQLESMRDWGGKLAGATIRLAAVLHAVEHGPEGEINRTSIKAAIAIARYLIPHADSTLGMMEASDDQAESDARYLLRWIRRHERGEFSKTEAQHHGKRRFPKAKDIDPAIHELTRRGYLRPLPSEAEGAGRPASPRYEVNPAVLGNEEPEKRS